MPNSEFNIINDITGSAGSNAKPGYFRSRGQGQNVLGRIIGHIELKVLDAAAEMAKEIEEKMVDASYAQQRWQDRTGEARRLLFARAFAVGIEGSALGGVKNKDNPLVGLSQPQQRDGSFTMPGQVTRGVMIVAQGASDHNLWLEIAMGGRYAVILPTMHRMAPTIRTRLEQVMKEL